MNRILIALLLFPQVAFSQSIDSMASTLVSGLSRETNTRVAVLEFQDTGGVESAGSRVIQERITTAIYKKKVCILVERRLLHRVMGELRLQSTGIMDEATVHKLGKTLGADAIITGTISDIGGGKTEINARLIDVESAAVIGVGESMVPTTWSNTAVVEQEKDIGIKASMDSDLRQMKDLVGTEIVAAPGGNISVGGTTVTPQEFDVIAMSAIMSKAETSMSARDIRLSEYRKRSEQKIHRLEGKTK